MLWRLSWQEFYGMVQTVGLLGTIFGDGVRLCRIDGILRGMDEILEDEDCWKPNLQLDNSCS